MGPRHPSTPQERAQIASTMIAHVGDYGMVTALSHAHAISRQALYAWKATALAALIPAFVREPSVRPAVSERLILTLLVQGHASERGIQACLAELGRAVGLGTISEVIAQAEKRALTWMTSYTPPPTPRVLALDEIYGNTHHAAYLTVLDARSGAVWATSGPIAADAESWTLLLWEVQDRGIRWDQTISDGNRPIGDACQTAAPARPHARDVWHVEREASRIQGHFDRVVERLVEQHATVVRQAQRIAAGHRPRGRMPQVDVVAHEAKWEAAQQMADGVAFLRNELRGLLEVVVRDRRGVLDAAQREDEFRALLALLAEHAQTVPDSLRRDLLHLHDHLRKALPGLLVPARSLDAVQQEVAAALGPTALDLLGWAWQRRRLLGPTLEKLVAQLPLAWRSLATRLFTAWHQTVRASSAVENWHSLLRPHLAVHRTLSPGRLALLAVWHNHRVFARGSHVGHNPLQRSGLFDAPTDWLVALGYPPQSATPSTVFSLTKLPLQEVA